MKDPTWRDLALIHLGQLPKQTQLGLYPVKLEEILLQIPGGAVFLFQKTPLRMSLADGRVAVENCSLEQMVNTPPPINVVFPDRETKDLFYNLSKNGVFKERFYFNPFSSRVFVDPNDKLGHPIFEYITLTSVQEGQRQELEAQKLELYFPAVKFPESLNMDRWIQMAGLSACLSEGNFYVVSGQNVQRFTVKIKGYSQPVVRHKSTFKYDASGHMHNLISQESPLIFFANENSRNEFLQALEKVGKSLQPTRRYNGTTGEYISYTIGAK